MCASVSSSQHLSDTYFGVRNKCLQLLGCLGMVDAPLSKDNEGLGSSIGALVRLLNCAFIVCRRLNYRSETKHDLT